MNTFDRGVRDFIKNTDLRFRPLLREREET